MDEQSFIKRKRLLEAIDVLRGRKYRPNIEGIVNYLFRRYNVHPSETKSDLEWCVSNKSILCVHYKGAISYRNALKKNQKSRARHSKQSQVDVMNYKSNVRKNFMELLTNVFAELAMEKTYYLEVGVPPTEITQQILLNDSVQYTERKIAMLLEGQVRRRHLIKLENGNFMLGPCPDNKHKEMPTRKRGGQQHKSCSTMEQQQKQAKLNIHSKLGPVRGRPRKTLVQEQAKLKIRKKLNNPENTDSEIEGGIQQLGRRLKIAKKVFDPSDTSVTKTRGQHKHKSNLKNKQQNPKLYASDSNIVNKLGRSPKSLKESPKDDEDWIPSSHYSAELSKVEKLYPSDTNVVNKRGRPPKSLKESPKDDKDWIPSSYNSTELSKGEGGVCSVCHNASVKNGKLVTCRECSNKAHHGCLIGDDMMLKMSPDNTWQCPHCKTCVVCFQTSKAGNLIICSVCADGYHDFCHQPKFIDKIENNKKWLCANCQGKEEMKPNDIQFHIGEAISYNLITDCDKLSKKGKYSPLHSSLPSVSGTQRRNYSKSSKNMGDSDDDLSESNSPTPEPTSNYESPPQSPMPSGSGIQRKKYLESSKNEDDAEEDSSDSSSPSVSGTQGRNYLKSSKVDKYYSSSRIDTENLELDASHWTPDEVYEYFAKIISEDEAKIFKDERIDGRSLLCLGRSEKTDPSDNATQSAHPARFSPEDQYSRQRITIKTRFGILKTQTVEPVY